MPPKSHFTYEEKKRAVEECKSGKISENGCATKYGVALSTLRGWLRLYEMRGLEGLRPSKQNRKYDIETKVKAVKDYKLDGVSQESVCKKYNISDTKMLRQWITSYNGQKDFNHPKAGGRIYMTKGRATTQTERVEIVSHCISNNKDYGKSIEKYSVSYQQVYGWVRKYEKHGIEGLEDKRGKQKKVEEMSETDKLKVQIKLEQAKNQRLQMENDLLKKLAELERWDA